jgi:mRNA interferase ChpB
MGQGAGQRALFAAISPEPWMDMEAREGRRLERLSEAIVNEVLARLEAILS